MRTALATVGRFYRDKFERSIHVRSTIGSLKEISLEQVQPLVKRDGH